MGQESKMDLIEKAKLAQAVERYQDMALFMEMAAEHGLELSGEERTLFCTAFKKITDERRMSLRAIVRIENVEGTSDSKRKLIQTYKNVIVKELQEIYGNVLRILDYYLIPACGFTEVRVSYLTMKGDYFRYLIHIASEDQDETFRTHTYQTYKEAHMMSRTILNAVHPVRLGVALNFSVCCYDDLDKRDEAFQLCYDALTEAESDYHNVDQNNYVATVLILQFLRDNLELWGVPYRSENKTDANVNVLSKGKLNGNKRGGSKQGSKGIASTTNCNETVVQSDDNVIQNEESDQICGTNTANEIVHKENQCTNNAVHDVQTQSYNLDEINLSGIETTSQNDEMNCNATQVNYKEAKPGCSNDQSIWKGMAVCKDLYNYDDFYLSDSDMDSSEGEGENDEISK